MNIEELVKIPYTTRPSMSKNTGSLYHKTPSSRYLQQKELELSVFGDQLWGITQESVIGKLVEKSSEHLGIPIQSSIVNFARYFQEDVAIIHHGKLEAICFCFPSGWIPSSGIGKTLMELHGPVADGDHLRSVSDRIASTIQNPSLGSFRRGVWTITKNGELSNHPSKQTDYEHRKPQLDQLYFRWETQTTEPLSDGNTALFFVDVGVKPLIELWPEWSDRIMSSLNSMTDSVAEYKNLISIRQYLNTL